MYRYTNLTNIQFKFEFICIAIYKTGTVAYIDQHLLNISVEILDPHLDDFGGSCPEEPVLAAAHPERSCAPLRAIGVQEHHVTGCHGFLAARRDPDLPVTLCV